MNETLIKARAFDKLIAHLKAHENDERKRERIRIEIALSKIDSWLKKAEQELKNER